MTVTLMAAAAEEALVRDALAALTMPKGVRLLRFFFDADHSGDPAVRVIYGVSKRIPLTSARGKELAALSLATALAVGKIGIDRIAYTTFEDVR